MLFGRSTERLGLALQGFQAQVPVCVRVVGYEEADQHWSFEYSDIIAAERLRRAPSQWRRCRQRCRRFLLQAERAAPIAPRCLRDSPTRWGQ